MAVTFLLSVLLSAPGALAYDVPVPVVGQPTTFDVAAGTGDQDDFDEDGFYVAVRSSRAWFPGNGHIKKGFYGGIEAGRQLNDLLSLGLLVQLGVHNASHFEIMADDPSASGPPGDFTLARIGVNGRVFYPVGPLLLGARGELAFARWRSPFEEVAYQEVVLPELGGGDWPRAGAGAWLGGAFELGLPLVDEGPTLMVSTDLGLLAVPRATGLLTGLSLGVSAPF